jgi:hypothetical protein
MVKGPMIENNKVKITKLPPGRALGAGDLHEWAQRRNAGRSGVYVGKTEREQQARRLEDAADRWLRRAERRERRR